MQQILPRGAVRYHFIIPNIKKLLGRFHQDQTNAAYYNLAFQDCPTKICECEGAVIAVWLLISEAFDLTNTIVFF